jgi:hypothetical protein
MRPSPQILAGTAVLAILALTPTMTASASASASASLPASATTTQSTLRFNILFHDDFIDLGDPGPSSGDETIVHDTLVTPAGASVGHDGGVCTFTDVTVPEANCVITFSLPRGQITTQFLNTPPPQKTGAITGGTGAYRDVLGQISLTENGDQTGTIVFTIDR